MNKANFKYSGNWIKCLYSSACLPWQGSLIHAKKTKFFLKYSPKSLIYVTFMLTFSQSALLRNSQGPIPNIVSLFPVISYNKILLIRCTEEERRCRSNQLKRKEKHFWLMCRSPWKDHYTIIPVDLEGQKCFFNKFINKCDSWNCKHFSR